MLFWAVIIGIIVGTYLFVQWAKRKRDRDAGGGPQGPTGAT